MDRARTFFGLRAGGRPAADPNMNLPGYFPVRQAPNADSSSPQLLNAQTYFDTLFVKPVTLLVYMTLTVLWRFTRLLYFLDCSNERSVSSAGTTVSNALMNDPIARCEHFARELEENLSPSQQFSSYHSDSNLQHLPPFFQGSYTQALYMASTRAKFLYVYLTNPMSEGSRSLFDTIITNQKFISIFTKDDDAIIWGGDVTDPEAYQLANGLNITKFPMIGLLCLTRSTKMTPEGPRKSSPRISLVSKIQGGLGSAIDPNSIIHNKFIKRMAKYEPDLKLVRAELRDKYLAEAMRRRQDANYRRSLLIDQQKKHERQRKKLTEKYLKWRQPYFKTLQTNREVSDTSRIAIKFDNGRRVKIMFPKASPIKDIFIFVELHIRDMLEDSYESTMSEADAQELFEGFELEFKYKLTSTIPPRPSLNELNLETRIEDVNYIFPSGLLMVENL